MYRMVKDGDVILLFSTVKGLKSEGDRLKEAVLDLDFEIGALPISGGELEGLQRFIEEDLDMDVSPSKPERIYAKNLSRFGDVSLPPPSYIALLKICMDDGKVVEPLDMDEEHYSMAYCEHVSGTQWILQSLREKRIKKKTFKSDDAREFVKEWDEEINKLRGYSELEEHRERVMAKNLERIVKGGDILGIIEVERTPGIVKRLQEEGWTVDDKT